MKKIIFLLFSIFLLQATIVYSAGFSVTPTRVELSAKKNRYTLSFSNTSDTPTLVQLESVLWEQEDGKEKLTPTEDILAVPAVFTVEPGKKQVIRVALRRPVDARQELSYRLLITEVPDETKKGAEGVSVALRVSVPVFVKPKTDAKPLPEWSLERINDKQIKLALKNKGNAHIQIGQVKLFTDTLLSQPVIEKALSAYVLPGQTGSWILAADTIEPAANLKLDAYTDGGKVETVLTLGETPQNTVAAGQQSNAFE